MGRRKRGMVFLHNRCGRQKLIHGVYPHLFLQSKEHKFDVKMKKLQFYLMHAVSYSAYECRKAFLNKYYNFYEKTKNQKILFFEDILYATKYSLVLGDKKKVK